MFVNLIQTLCSIINVCNFFWYPKVCEYVILRWFSVFKREKKIKSMNETSQLVRVKTCKKKYNYDKNITHFLYFFSLFREFKI